MNIVRLGAAAVIAASVAACAATPETGQGAKENTGTVVGALAGGLIGSQFSAAEPASASPRDLPGRLSAE